MQTAKCKTHTPDSRIRTNPLLSHWDAQNLNPIVSCTKEIKLVKKTSQYQIWVTVRSIYSQAMNQIAFWKQYFVVPNSMFPLTAFKDKRPCEKAYKRMRNNLTEYGFQNLCQWKNGTPGGLPSLFWGKEYWGGNTHFIFCVGHGTSSWSP